MAYKKPDYHTLYKATFPNGKVYIGITSRFLEDRIWSHTKPSQNKKPRPMYRALKKYQGSVVWEKLLTFDKKEDVQYAETAFIKFYGSNDPKKGYNLTEGGESNFGIKRPELLQVLIDNSGNIFNGYEEAMSYYGFTRPQIRCSIVSGSYCGHVYFSKYVEGMLTASPRTVSKKYRRRVIDHNNGIIFFSVADACSYHGITQTQLKTLCKLKKYKKNEFSYFEAI